MTINTQKLREAASGAKEFASVGVVTHPHTAKAHINGLADAVATCCGEIDAQAAEIARLRDGIEEAIRLLGLDRPIDPTDTLRAALSGECHD